MHYSASFIVHVCATATAGYMYSGGTTGTTSDIEVSGGHLEGATVVSAR